MVLIAEGLLPGCVDVLIGFMRAPARLTLLELEEDIEEDDAEDEEGRGKDEDDIEVGF